MTKHTVDMTLHAKEIISTFPIVLFNSDVHGPAVNRMHSICNNYIDKFINDSTPAFVRLYFIVETND